MAYPKSGSILTAADGINRTGTALSTNIIIRVNDIPVGAVQNLQIRENRTITQVDEVGTDGHIDSAPTKSTDISGSCTRVRFDRLRVTEAFSRGFLHASSQVYPFDIEIIDRQKSDPANWITTTIKNVWVQSLSYAYDAGNWLITDNMDWVAEHIYSNLGLGTGGGAAAVGGERQIPFDSFVIPNSFVNDSITDGQSVERAADQGLNGRRGSFDVAGILDLEPS